MPSVASMEYQWSDEKLTPRDYISQFAGPQVVRLTSTPSHGSVDLGDLLDTSRPFVLYSHRRRTKVYADLADWQPSSTSYQPTGPSVEIPKDYIGWFEVMPAHDNKTSCMTSLKEVAEDGCECFLSTSVIHGFLLEEETSEEVQLGPEHQVLPGEVLKVIKVACKQWKTTNPGSKAETRFLHCADLRHRQILLPLGHPGHFYVVANSYDKHSKCTVYQISSLLGVIPLPVVVRLVFGWMPRISLPTSFTGYFRLKQCQRPDSLILHQLNNNSNILTELPFDADVLIQPASSSDSPEFHKAVQFCRDMVYPFAVNVKGLEQPYQAGGQTEVMASPCEMESFSRSDVYPSLESQMVAELWSLTFKDPEAVIGRVDIGTIGESDTDGGRVSPMSTLRRQVRQRAREQTGSSDTRDSNNSNTHDSRSQSISGTDPRTRKICDIFHREAKC